MFLEHTELITALASSTVFPFPGLCIIIIFCRFSSFKPQLKSHLPEGFPIILSCFHITSVRCISSVLITIFTLFTIFARSILEEGLCFVHYYILSFQNIV